MKNLIFAVLAALALSATASAQNGSGTANAADTKTVTAPAPPPAGTWLGEELPLPLVVKTTQDLALKAVADTDADPASLEEAGAAPGAVCGLYALSYSATPTDMA